MFTQYHPILISEHFAPISPKIVDLIARLQSSSADRLKGLSPHVNWSLKEPKKSSYTRHCELSLTPQTYNIPTKISESPCPCRGNTQTTVHFG